MSQESRECVSLNWDTEANRQSFELRIVVMATRSSVVVDNRFDTKYPPTTWSEEKY